MTHHPDIAPPPLWLVTALAAGTLALAVWAAPHVAAMADKHAAVEGITRATGCRAPTEVETLLIIVAERDGRLVIAGCTYAGSTGTYHRRAGK